MHLSFNLNNINTKTIFVFQIVYSDKISQTKILTPSNIQRKKYPVVRVQVTLDSQTHLIFASKLLFSIASESDSLLLLSLVVLTDRIKTIYLYIMINLSVNLTFHLIFCPHDQLWNHIY